MNKKETRLFHLRMNKDTLVKIKDICFENNISISNYINEIIEREVNNDK